MKSATAAACLIFLAGFIAGGKTWDAVNLSGVDKPQISKADQQQLSKLIKQLERRRQKATALQRKGLWPASRKNEAGI